MAIQSGAVELLDMGLEQETFMKEIPCKLFSYEDIASGSVSTWLQNVFWRNTTSGVHCP